MTWVLKLLGSIQVSPAIQKQSETPHQLKRRKVKITITINLCEKKNWAFPGPKITQPRLFWCLRTHLAHGGTKQVKIKLRCSQTVETGAAGGWDAECRSGGRSWAAPLRLRGARGLHGAPAHSTAGCLHCHHPFFLQKWKCDFGERKQVLM